MFAEPFGIVMLGSAAIQRAALGLPALRVIEPKLQETRDFLDEIGFVDLVESASAGRLPSRAPGPLSVRRLSSSSLDPSFAADVARSMERLVPGTSESVAYSVELWLNELLQNVTEHAHSGDDCVVHARWYAKQENLRIAVADAGIGLVESLQKNPRLRHLDDRRLVEQALTVPGVTGRTSGRFGGFGLKSLRDFVVARGGAINVVSGIVFARVDPRGVRSEFAPRCARHDRRARLPSAPRRRQPSRGAGRGVLLMRIRVRDVCPESRVFRSDGARLRDEVVRKWSAEDPLEVDFEGETIASLSFLDEAIAVLFLDHDPELVRARLRPLNLTEGDRRVLNQRIAYRIRERGERRARDAGV